MTPLPVTVSDIAAFSALAVAIWSAVQTGRFNRRQNAFAETAERLNRLLIDKESAESQAQRKADVGANFVKIAKNDYRLKVFNRGPVVARNVRLEFLAGGEVMMASELKQKLPIPALERHQTVELMASINMQSPRRAQMRIHWDDDSGTCSPSAPMAQI
ncbi:hypothetical protein [Novosphingobium sp. CECT 9465]|uniref:hypothetical protein n=1 Tax=Novosphingobium sp. CECT 9465 TaxID=2829794 RepID=UPI001E4B3E01|nr:hypothetical protein [Novosphingobium sp. CECT 9465]CAH0498172.1 hypothetical protein NVSP9465_03249 [Novosphingobium sp. CECT 9465]